MTTTRFNALAGATARAMGAVHAKHLPTLDSRPPETLRGTLRCERCGGLLSYTVSSTRATSGRCSSSNCIRWSEHP